MLMPKLAALMICQVFDISKLHHLVVQFLEDSECTVSTLFVFILVLMPKFVTHCALQCWKLEVSRRRRCLIAHQLDCE